MEETYTEKYPVAAALRYRQNQNNAPYLVAKGRGELARKIIEGAKDNDVAIIKNVNLVDILMSIKIEEQIPQQIFAVVAEIYAFLHHMDSMYETNHI